MKKKEKDINKEIMKEMTRADEVLILQNRY